MYTKCKNVQIVNIFHACDIFFVMWIKQIKPNIADKINIVNFSYHYLEKAINFIDEFCQVGMWKLNNNTLAVILGFLSNKIKKKTK